MCAGGRAALARLCCPFWCGKGWRATGPDAGRLCLVVIWHPLRRIRGHLVLFANRTGHATLHTLYAGRVRCGEDDALVLRWRNFIRPGVVVSELRDFLVYAGVVPRMGWALTKRAKWRFEIG